MQRRINYDENKSKHKNDVNVQEIDFIESIGNYFMTKWLTNIKIVCFSSNIISEKTFAKILGETHSHKNIIAKKTALICVF